MTRLRRWWRDLMAATGGNCPDCGQPIHAAGAALPIPPFTVIARQTNLIRHLHEDHLR